MSNEIEKDGIGALYGSEFTDINQLSYHGSSLWDDSIQGYEYNPEKAKELLKEAGYENGLKTSIIIENNEQNSVLCETLKSYLADVGIDMDIDLADSARYAQTVIFSSWGDQLAIVPFNYSPDEICSMLRMLHPDTSLFAHTVRYPDEYRDMVIKMQTSASLDEAKAAGAVISFDPNLRAPLWNDLEDARKEIDYGLKHCDVLKISDNEVEFMCGTDDYDKGAAILKEKYNIPLILITLGKNGSRAYYKDLRVEAAPFLQENTIETTGAGDTFCATSLHYVLKYGIDGFDEEKLKELLVHANAAASLITTRKGALRVMPTAEEVNALAAQA